MYIQLIGEKRSKKESRFSRPGLFSENVWQNITLIPSGKDNPVACIHPCRLLMGLGKVIHPRT